MEFEISSAKLAAVVESLITGIGIFSLYDGNKIAPVYLNDGLYRMLGYSHKDLDRMLVDIRRNIIPDDLPIFEEGINEIMKDDGAVEFVFRTVTGDGGIRWLQVRANLYGKMDGYPLVACVIIDATERKSAEEELALQAERMNILSQSTKEHLMDYNSRTDVMSIRLGSNIYKKGEKLIPKFVEEYNYDGVHPDDVSLVSDILQAARMNSLSDMVDFRCKLFEEPFEDYHWYRATISSVRGADGYVSRVVGRILNIDEEKKKELELKIKADRDALTGLYNKGATTTLIQAALDKCEQDGTNSALIMIDLDHFKSVNDTFGHAIGDKVLEDAGVILDESFKGRDIVGRMGGDEFMVLMNGIKGEMDALIIAERLNEALTREVSDSQGTVTVTASIGIAIYEKGDDFARMYEKADQALYKTKENGRNGRTLYKA